TKMEGSELVCSVTSYLDGKLSGHPSLCRADTRDSLAQRVREKCRRQRSNEVYHRLGLSLNEIDALRLYLALDSDVAEPLPIDARPEDIAVAKLVQQGVLVHTARNRIVQALYRLATPNPRRHHPGDEPAT